MNAALKSSAPEPVKFKELFTNREKALNFELVARRVINDLRGPAGAAGAPDPRLPHLESLAEKMRLIAHSPDAESLNIDLSLAENTELYSLMGENRLSEERIKNNKEKMSAEDREALVRFIALHPEGHPELAGLLGVEGGEERIRRAVDSLAFSNPNAYTDVMNRFAQSRRFMKGDGMILKPLFKITDAYEGVDKRLVLNAINNPAPGGDWIDQVVQAATPALEGKYRLASAVRVRWLRTKLNFMDQHFMGIYQSHGPERNAQVTAISDAVMRVFTEPGIASSVLTREAMLPNAPTDSKMTYDNMRAARASVEGRLSDEAYFARRARALFSRDQDWDMRNDPVVGERYAQQMLDSEYSEQVSAADRAGGPGTGWEALFRVFASLFGTAYGAQERNSVASRIGRLP